MDPGEIYSRFNYFIEKSYIWDWNWGQFSSNVGKEFHIEIVKLDVIVMLGKFLRYHQMAIHSYESL